MSEQQQPLALVAAGVCTQAGDTDFAAHAAVALKLNGAKPDADLTVPGPSGDDEPPLGAPLAEEVLPVDLTPAQRMTSLLAQTLGGLTAELGEAPLPARTLIHVLLPPTKSARGEDLNEQALKEIICTLQPTYTACSWHFSRGECGSAAFFDSLSRQDWDLLVLVGADSWLDLATSFELAKQGRLMTAGARQGVVPGEAAAAVALAREAEAPRAWLRGWSVQAEPASGQAEHKRLEGLHRAATQALAAAQVGADAVGEVWHGLGAELAGELEWYQLRRALWPGRPLQGAPLAQRPAQAFGEVGVAALPLTLALAAASFEQARRLSAYGFPPPGPVLICDTPQAPQRGAVCLTPA